MTWIEHCQKKYQLTGTQAPVFLWPNMNKKRVFVDVENGKVELEYSYDPIENYHPMGNDMQWQKLESGQIENDFAFEMLGISAVRLRVTHAGNEGVGLHIFEKKAV